MSHHKLREDKTCLNCGTTVNERYCPHCGQENIETHQTFGGLLTHFVEDLVHYEGSFWKTIKYLFTRPGYITKEFLKGKRGSYLPPVKLYIFVSFAVFFLPHIIPQPHSHHIETTPKKQAEIDSIMAESSDDFAYITDIGFIFKSRYKNIQQLDSAKLALKGTDKEIDWMEYFHHKKAIELRKRSPGELWEMFIESLERSFPKTLFVIMPLFAFVLWLFHGKKRWLYFDHAIFTLHYFSFMLLGYGIFNTLMIGTDWAFMAIDPEYDTIFIESTGLTLLFGWFFFYFFKAHNRFYEEQIIMSALKGLAIFTINLFLFLTIFIAWVLFTVYSLH